MHPSLIPSDPPLGRAGLRQQLELLLRTDSALEAFCLDYFPGTYLLFTQGMDRQQKLTLLLQHEDLPHITKRLSDLTRPVVTCRAPLPEVRSLRRASAARTMGWLGLSALALTGVGSFLFLSTPSYEQLAPTRVSPAPVLRSVPPGAEIWDLSKGRFLGTTPLFIEPSVLPLMVCLRRAGFQDTVITLAHGQLLPNSVVLRPVGSSPSEVCDVPIPIIP